MRIRFYLCIILVILFSCKKKNLVPQPLAIAYNYLDRNWDKNERLAFIALKEKEFTPFYYDYPIQEQLQTALLTNHKESKRLNHFFDSLGIQRTIDKAGLILNTYRNHLNAKDIELNNAVKKIKAYWQPREVCENDKKIKAMHNYERYDVGDLLVIKLPIDEYGNAVDYKCPEISWDFKENKDLKITVKLIEKTISIDSTEAYFRLKLLNSNRDYTEILMEDIYKGDTFDINLYNSWKIISNQKSNETATIDL